MLRKILTALFGSKKKTAKQEPQRVSPAEVVAPRPSPVVRAAEAHRPINRRPESYQPRREEPRRDDSTDSSSSIPINQMNQAIIYNDPEPSYSSSIDSSDSCSSSSSSSYSSSDSYSSSSSCD